MLTGSFLLFAFTAYTYNHIPATLMLFKVATTSILSAAFLLCPAAVLLSFHDLTNSYILNKLFSFISSPTDIYNTVADLEQREVWYHEDKRVTVLLISVYEEVRRTTSPLQVSTLRGNFISS